MAAAVRVPAAPCRSPRAPFRRRSDHPVPIRVVLVGRARRRRRIRRSLASARRRRPRTRHVRAGRARRATVAWRRVAAAARALCPRRAPGRCAGFTGGRIDDVLMRLADFVLVLPAIYVVMVLRAAMPLVLTQREVFWTMVAVLALAGWPYSARGVRAIVAAERGKEYAEAARASGRDRCGFCSAISCLPTGLPCGPGARCSCRPSSWPKRRCRLWGSGSRNLLPSWGVMLQDAARRASLPRRPGCWRRRRHRILRAGALSGGRHRHFAAASPEHGDK